jgi:hypothetical protein
MREPLVAQFVPGSQARRDTNSVELICSVQDWRESGTRGNHAIASLLIVSGYPIVELQRTEKLREWRV